MLNGKTRYLFPKVMGLYRIDTDPYYQRIVEAYSNRGRAAIVVWASDNWFESELAHPDGAQRFIFQFNIVNGCHACGTGFVSRFAFDFGPDGQLRQFVPLGICRRRPAGTEVPAIPDCPPSQLPDP